MKMKKYTGIIAALLTIIVSLLIIIFFSSCQSKTETIIITEYKDQEAVTIEQLVYADEEVIIEENARSSTITKQMEDLHQLAEKARTLGFAEDSEVIKGIQTEWVKEQKELKILARTIFSESQDCPIEHQIAVGCVVINRVNDSDFPNTIEGVITAKRQYNPDYAINYENLDDHYYLLARDIIDGIYSIPVNVVYQNTKPQGSGTWWKSHVKTSWWESTTYFCYK